MSKRHYTRVDRMRLRQKINKDFEDHGYISIHQAWRIARRRSMPKKTAQNIFYALQDAAYVKMWNPGEIRYVSENHICPIHAHTIIAKKQRGHSYDYSHVENQSFCIMNAEDDEDYKRILENLVTREYHETTHFPPLLGQFFVAETEGERKVMWVEKEGHRPRKLARDRRGRTLEQ